MPRSLWGWGDVEKAVSLDEVRPRVQAFFGEAGEQQPAEPRLPAARVEVPAALRALASSSDAERASHAMGKAWIDRMRGFRGDYSSAPDFVARPRSEQDLERILEVAATERLAVIPFGGGSSVVGGVEPIPGPRHRGSVSVDLGALDALLEVDDVSRVARLQAGVSGPKLEAQLGAHGFTLRHFPQSFEFSSLGGWIATRAAGHFATLTTHIDDLVEALRVVTPKGLWESRRVPASGAGPAPDRLMIGSEGTLGIITEAWVRVLPRPSFRASASVAFDDLLPAVEATRELAQSGLYPSNCRLLDAAEALLNGVSGEGPVLVLAFESADHPLGPWLDRALAIAAGHGGRATPRGTDAAPASEAWRASFLKGPYLQDAMIRLGILADTFETACTWRAFPALYEGVKAAVEGALERVCGGGLVTCRFTHVYPDGPAPYFTFLGRARAGGELEQWAELKAAASQAVAAAGGTITHHHSVGRAHRPWYDAERPPLFGQVLTAAKRTLDPGCLLNPGVLIDPW